MENDKGRLFLCKVQLFSQSQAGPKEISRQVLSMKREEEISRDKGQGSRGE